MTSKSTNFLHGLEFYFITKKLVRAQHKILVDKIKIFGGTVSHRFNENTTHVLFPRGVDYNAGLQSLKSTPRETVHLVSIDWLPVCIVERKIVPETQFEVKRCGIETSQSSESGPGSLPGDPINGTERSSRLIRFSISGTSKFSGARKVVGKTGKEVFLQRTLARGSQNGIGVFSLTEEGEQQIGWVPEKDQAIMDAVEKAYDLPNFHAKIDSTSIKNMGDNFSKITIFIISEGSLV